MRRDHSSASCREQNVVVGLARTSRARGVDGFTQGAGEARLWSRSQHRPIRQERSGNRGEGGSPGRSPARTPAPAATLLARARSTDQPPRVVPRIPVWADPRRRARAGARAEQALGGVPPGGVGRRARRTGDLLRADLRASGSPLERRVPHPAGAGRRSGVARRDPGARRRTRNLGHRRERRQRPGARPVPRSTRRRKRPERARSSDPRSRPPAGGGRGRSSRRRVAGNNVPVSSSSTLSASAPARWRTNRSPTRFGPMLRIATR